MGAMPENPVTVIAELNAKPGSERQLQEILIGILGEVRAEEGCILYDLHVSNAEPGNFAFYETWQSPEALRNHARSEHMAVFAQQAQDLLAGPARILTYTKIG